MAVEMFSWPSLHERMCRTWGSNSGPLACQANSLPIELPRPVCSKDADRMANSVDPDKATVKILNNRTPKNCSNCPKIRTESFYYRSLGPKDVDRIANSVDSDQTATLGLFAQTCLSENLGKLRYFFRSSLIGVCAAFPDLSVRIFRNITVLLKCAFSCCLRFCCFVWPDIYLEWSVYT